MFQPQMIYYEIYKPVVVKNQLNESIKSYQYLRTSPLAITANSSQDYQVNGTNVFTVEYAGLTKDHDIHKDYKIGDEYIVEHVENHRLYDVVYMREISNDGDI